MIGRTVAVVAHWVAELFAPVDKRAKSYATMGGADRPTQAEERGEVLEPRHSDGGPVEWLAEKTPHLAEVGSPDGVDGPAVPAREVPGASPAAAGLSEEVADWIGYYDCPCGGAYEVFEDSTPENIAFLKRWFDEHRHCGSIRRECDGVLVAPESSVGVVQPAPADVVPGPSSPPNQATDPGQPSREPRVVAVLGEAERDAVWQCQELAPTRGWNALYRWNPRRGLWEYMSRASGGRWGQAAAGHRDVAALTINPVKADGLVVEFVEIADHPDLLGAVEGPEVLIDDVAEVLCTGFTRGMLTRLGDDTSPADEFWIEGLDESGRDLFRDFARDLLTQFNVSRK